MVTWNFDYSVFHKQLANEMEVGINVPLEGCKMKKVVLQGSPMWWKYK
jgi:hypothetical protein